MITAPLGRARNAPNAGASIRKPPRPNGLVSLCINRGRYQTILAGRAATPQLRALSAQKKIRAAHAKEKQQIQETCNRPNRLNLLSWTVPGGCRSNYLRFFRVREIQLRQALITSSPLGSNRRPAPPRPLPPEGET